MDRIFLEITCSEGDMHRHSVLHSYVRPNITVVTLKINFYSFHENNTTYPGKTTSETDQLISECKHRTSCHLQTMCAKISPPVTLCPTLPYYIHNLKHTLILKCVQN